MYYFMQCYIQHIYIHTTYTVDEIMSMFDVYVCFTYFVTFTLCKGQRERIMPKGSHFK